jgi:hypothetical protein
VNSNNEKHRSIDLVHWSRKNKDWYEFIELKVEAKSGRSPLFAAMEILQYGILYLFSRKHAKKMGYDVDQKPFLKANGVHLQVLAPSEYYDQERIHLGWLQDKINEGIRTYLRDETYQMDFEFLKWPPDLDLHAILNNQASSDSEIVRAFSQRKPVYP